MSSLSHLTGSQGQARQDDVAIIGMSCIFPGAPDLRTYWQNIIAKVDATGDPPEDWEAELFYDPTSSENDRIYCKRGGYLGDLARFDPLQYGVMPNSIDGGDPDQFLALRVAYEALADAGYTTRAIDRERIEVIIGRGTYINRGFMTLVQHGVVVDRTLRILKQLHPEHTEEELQTLKRELKASLPPFNAEMAPGLVPNIMSGRITNRLDFMGPNYTVDAACASSLIAVDRGMQDLLSGRCDIALVGGVQASTPAPILMVFCQLNALSRQGQIRPFDKDADGTLLGEGLGLIVLKRREDAERDGNRIYALIKGIGSASDGRALGLLTPRIEGEELALRRAYEAAGISPRTVNLIEAHGTGTLVGDLTEIQALTRVFGPRDGESPWCAVGSVKSMISHLIPAAGIAGLIKTTLALYHKVLPPTLNCDEPAPKLELEKTPFYINTESRPWIHGASTPRRAGVNAFGFGGINAHAILEEHTGAPQAESSSYQHCWDTEVCIIQGDSRPDLLQQCERLKSYLAGAPQVELKDLAYTLNSQLTESSCRLTIVAASLSEVERKLTHALQRLADPQRVRIKDQSGIYFFQEPLSQQGKLAFLFPGEGSQYLNMLADLCIHFPEVRTWFDLIDRAFINHARNYLPSQVIFPPPRGKGPIHQERDEKRLWQMDCGAEAVFTANQAMFSLLSQLHIRPQAVLGHSTGEYSALIASGANQVEDEEHLIRGILELNGLYEQLLTSAQIPEAVLVALGGADRDLVFSIVEQEADLYIAMDNCPNQIVLCGTPQSTAKAIEQLRVKGVICALLPFNRAYHTPMFQPFCEQLDAFFQRLMIVPPQIEMYSCITAQPFPPAPAEIRRLAVAQWASPLRFRDTIETMYEAGVRLFVEVGPRNNLTAFVNDILRGKSCLAVASNVPSHSGITQLNHLVALLAAHAVPMQLDYLYARRSPQRLWFEAGNAADSKPSVASGSMRLPMGLQPLRLKEDRSYERSDEHTGPPRFSPLLAAAGTQSHLAGQALSRNASSPPGAAAQSCHEPDTHHAGFSFTTGSLSPSMQTMQESGLHDQPSSQAKVMQEYLSTMEQFLHLQQHIMQAYLSGATSTMSLAHGLDGAGDEGAQLTKFASQVAACPTEETAVADNASELALDVTQPLPSADDDHLRSPDTIARALLELVSEKTGYPVEMLDFTLNLEAELGIDSIKRVEILGAFQRQTGLFQAQDMDRVTSLTTLQQIIDFLMQGDRREEGGVEVSSFKQDDTTLPLAPAPQEVLSLPFIGTITSCIPGQELVALRKLDLDEDIFLRDHTLGGRVSVDDEGLMALPVVPLTISMEMLAEAAVALLPNKLLIGMKDIRAYRWISLDKGQLTLQLVARRNASESEQEVEVQMREVIDPSPSEANPGTPIVEGTVVFGDRYPDTAQAGEIVLKSERASTLAAEQLYAEYMFHGPSFQGVASVDRWGEDGAEGTLSVLPTHHFFRSRTNPTFLTDPVLLDAAGQLVGYWTAEHLETGFHVFPFGVEALHIYGPHLRPGERAQCRLRLALVGERQIRSDIDIIRPDGRLLMQLVGWWDRRFDLPERFCRLRISPREALLSTPWLAPMAQFATPEAFSCCRLDDLSPAFFEAYGHIWRRALASLVLSRRERDTWQSLKGPERRQTEWLLGRVAAKDAIRLFLRQHYGMELCPADIEIAQDEYGQPQVRGSWTAELARVPVISLSHADGIAVAVAGDDGRCRGIGIDVEHIGQRREGFESVVLTLEEQSLLSSLDVPSRKEWFLRLWCAKEAVAKTTGRGLVKGPGGLKIQDLDLRTGMVQVALSGELAKALPHLAERYIAAYTVRENDVVCASALV